MMFGWGLNLFYWSGIEVLIKRKTEFFQEQQNINEIVNGPYRGYGYSRRISDPINLATSSQRKLLQFYKFQLFQGILSSSFWSGNFFLIAPFPDHGLLLPFYKEVLANQTLEIYIFLAFQIPLLSTNAY